MLTTVNYHLGDRVRITSFPGDSKGFTGKIGKVAKIDHGSRGADLLVTLEDGSGQPWCSERWVELVVEPEPEESGLEFWEGDRVRGASIKDDATLIEGIVQSVGRKYLKLTSGEAIHKATAEMVEPGAETPAYADDEPEPDCKLKKDDRVTHDTIPGVGTVKRILRRGAVEVEFPGLDGDRITSKVPAETLTLAMEDEPEDDGPRPWGSGEAFTGEFGRAYEEEAIAPEVETVTAEIVPTGRDRLTQLESEIEEGMKLVEQGQGRIMRAAHAIREENLWQLEGDSSFKAYMKRSFGWSESNAHEVDSAGEVANRLLNSGVPESSLPESVSAYRLLKNLPPEQASAALQKANEVTKGKPTAKAVRAAVAEIQTQQANTETLNPLTPIECKPSITPAEFNAAMRESAEVRSAGCMSCKHQQMTGSGDRYYCNQLVFEDTRFLSQNWFVERGGCPAFEAPVFKPQPNYEVPEGIGRLKVLEDGSCEVFGLVLSEQQQMKLAALARTLPEYSSIAAIHYLIDQLPEVEL